MAGRSKTRFDFLPVGNQARGAWEDLCPLGEYRIVPSGSLPEVIPAGLRSKSVDSLVIGSGSADGYAYFVVNLLRKDEPAQAVDQQPFCLWFSGSDVAPSGCLVQHGDWTERTVNVPEEFFREVKRTGVITYMDLLSLPTARSGSLSSLSGSSHGAAFERVVEQVKKSSDVDS